jgi:large subunit ribosomal protein L3
MENKIFASKLGMTRIYEGNLLNPVTIVKIHTPHIIQIKTVEKDKYNALVVAYVDTKEKSINNQQLKLYKKLNIAPKKYISEIKSEDKLDFKESDIYPNAIEKYLKVKVTAISKGKGFQGVMKRHNFGGLRASHGVSISHRSHGSTGQCQDPGKVFKGKKMAGQMGNTRISVKNIAVLDIDKTNNLLYLKGTIPGSKNSIVEISY